MKRLLTLSLLFPFVFFVPSHAQQVNVYGESHCSVNTESAKCGRYDMLKRLYHAFDNTIDPELRQFFYTEIKKIHIRNGTW
jgi:hypothetical protein